MRLQRIMLLKELGLPLARIAEVLDRSEDPIAALEQHVLSLGSERERIDRQSAAVTATITRLKAGEPLMAEEMFDGFDHREHEQEVTERWGAEAYRRSDEWWSALSNEQKHGLEVPTSRTLSNGIGSLRRRRRGPAPNRRPVPGPGPEAISNGSVAVTPGTPAE
jgi:DNA-binding transcriptional MerR regulator